VTVSTSTGANVFGKIPISSSNFLPNFFEFVCKCRMYRHNKTVCDKQLPFF
jgi:hypothetical protein